LKKALEAWAPRGLQALREAPGLLERRGLRKECLMQNSIYIDREALTVLNVQFPDIDTLDMTVQAMGVFMMDGYQPTERGIKVILDYCLGKITLADVKAEAKAIAKENPSGRPAKDGVHAGSPRLS
jgi:putative transcriptional regulator